VVTAACPPQLPLTGLLASPVNERDKYLHVDVSLEDTAQFQRGNLPIGKQRQPSTAKSAERHAEQRY
jgi:hypothetical protein